LSSAAGGGQSCLNWVERSVLVVRGILPLYLYDQFSSCTIDVDWSKLWGVDNGGWIQIVVRDDCTVATAAFRFWCFVSRSPQLN
jgi:hypothetical protein